jgi:putative DNA methylase
MTDCPPTEGSKFASIHAIREARQLAFDELYRVPQAGYSLAMDDSFPEKFVDALSRSEVFNKHLFRPNTYLHKWWARRCGSTFRAILKQFVPDNERRDYYAPGGLEGKVVLDPMMGGGTTLHEAIRLGASVIGADIDPIPIVQARATLTQAALGDLRTAFNQFLADLHRHLGHYFQTECPTCQQTVDSQYTLYGLRKSCACGEVVQLDQYDLRHEADRKIRIWPQSWEITDGRSSPRSLTKATRLITKAEKVCPTCRQEYAELLDVPYYARYAPIAVVAVCPEHDLFFRSPGEPDRARIARAEEQRDALDFGPWQDFAVKDGPKSGDLLKRNVNSYLDVFSSRQLLYLHQAIQLLRDYDGVARLNLGLLVSTSLEFNSMLCGYKGWYKYRPGAIRHVFSLHAYSFPYTALENNPMNRQRTSGNLQLLFRDRIERGRKWAVLPIERRIDPAGKSQLVKIPGEVDGGVEVLEQRDLTTVRQAFWLIHGDSRCLPIEDHAVDLIVTDPPYYDSVQYSDLAAFFRVWLARLLPGEMNWTYNEADSAVATRATDGSSSFMTVLAGIFAECGRVLKRHTGRMIFTFHHWDPNAWAELTVALKDAGFKLMNAYVVFSEHPISVHINKLNAIKHDCILVFALDGDSPATPWSLLEIIDITDSETFCRQCGMTLGWLLESGYSATEIRNAWQELIQGRDTKLIFLTTLYLGVEKPV